MNAMPWLCKHVVHATYRTSCALQVSLITRNCEEGSCQKAASFGYPGGRPVRCGTHQLTGMVGRAAAVLRIPWDCRMGLQVQHHLVGVCRRMWCTPDAKNMAAASSRLVATQAAGECGVARISSHTWCGRC